MKLFDLIIIVPVNEVFLLEILLELFPHNFPFINLLHFPAVLPPYGCSSSQIENGYSSLHIFKIVLDLEIILDPEKPSLCFLTVLCLTIEGRRPFLLKLILWDVPIMPLALFPMRRRDRILSGSFRIRWSTRNSFSSSSTAPTSFWSYCLVPAVHLPLDVCQNL